MKSYYRAKLEEICKRIFGLSVPKEQIIVVEEPG